MSRNYGRKREPVPPRLRNSDPSPTPCGDGSESCEMARSLKVGKMRPGQVIQFTSARIISSKTVDAAVTGVIFRLRDLRVVWGPTDGSDSG